MQNVVEGVANQLVIHANAQLDPLEVVVSHLHAEQPVERHLLGKQVGDTA